MTTIKREKFLAIQAKGGDTENGKVVVDDVVEIFVGSSISLTMRLTKYLQAAVGP